MGGPLQVLKRSLLPPQILLRSIRSRHVARISAEPRLRTLRTNIVMRSARVPDDKISRSRIHLFPFTALVLQPLHTLSGKAIPLMSPSPDLVRLILKIPVELLTEKMRAFAND